MTNTRRLYTGLIFFVVLILLTVLRVLFATDLFAGFSDNEGNILYTLISQVFCMGIVPMGLYIVLIKNNDKIPPPTKVGLGFRVPPISIIILSIIAGFLFFYLTIGVAAVWTGIISIFGYRMPISPGTIFTTPMDLVLWVLIIGVLPGVFEEFTHRSILISAYAESSEEEAVIFSALLFGLMHQDIRQLGYAVAGGVILAYFFLKSRSIIPAMILHFTNNAFGTLLSYSSQTGGKLGEYYTGFFDLLSSRLIMLPIFLASCVLAGALIFGILILTDIISAKANNTQPTWRNKFKFKYRINASDTFLYAAIFLGVVTTIFSFVWSVMR